MPIQRTEDSPGNPLAATILLLWDKKWWIIMAAIAAGVLTYFIMRLLPEEFKAQSQIYVNRLTPTSDQNETISPAAIATLLENTNLLNTVRQDYQLAFDVKAAPIERWVNIFKVQTDVLQDTSVRKQLSPIINLEVQTQGSSETRFIMDRWINRFVEENGNLTAREAQAQTASISRAANQVEQELREVEKERALLQSTHPLHETLLAEKLERLSPAKMARSFLDQIEPQSDNSGDANQQVQMNLMVEAARTRQGLYEKLSEHELKLAGQTTATLATDPTAQYLRLQIQNTHTSITELSALWAGTASRLNQATRQAAALENRLDDLNQSLSRFNVQAALGATDAAAGSDVRKLTNITVTPEFRIWPKRTSVAAGMAIVAALLTIAGLLSMAYITRLKNNAQ